MDPEPNVLMPCANLPTQPEAIAYQYALQQWESFQTKSTALKLGECLQDPEGTPPLEMAAGLRVIPADERTPVAFGVFLRAARHWSPIEQTIFLGEFLPAPSVIERRILEAAARGALNDPERLPVTLEEFPSRIWKRAIASGIPARVVNAAHQSLDAMLRLYCQYEMEAEAILPDISALRPGESMEFLVPSGDLPPVMDLLGIAPYTLPEMKTRVLDHLMSLTKEGEFSISEGQDTAFDAWVFADTCEGPYRTSVVLRQLACLLKKLNNRKSLYSSHHAQRLGRLVFRLGLRRKAIRCAKALGISPWEQGWQFQPLSGSAHTRIRKLLIRPGVVANAWKTEPALACSAMSLPLWLVKPDSRVPTLVHLFNMAHACPWIFPRLYHVFQWHLALIGKQKALREVESIDPEFSVGLAVSALPTSTR